MPYETKITAPMYPRPKKAQASACHIAEPALARATGPYHKSHAALRCQTSCGPIPVTRTSFPGGAVVATVKRCRESRLLCNPRSCAFFSTSGLHVDVTTVGIANTAK